MNSIKILFSILLISFLLFGCSVYMAIKQPPKKDLNVLNNGIHRNVVISELGNPVYTEKISDGRKDTFKFVQGYSGLEKSSRAIIHSLADVYTFFTWELGGILVESYADGTKIILDVYYDENDKVKYSNIVNSPSSKD